MLLVSNTILSVIKIPRHTGRGGGVMEKKVGLPYNGESSGDHAK